MRRRHKNITEEDQEVIEVGAVLLEAKTKKPLSMFHSFVRPTLNPTLTTFCKKLTSIEQPFVDAAPSFAEVWRKFAYEWNATNGPLCSWGVFDWNLLMRECHRHNEVMPWHPMHFVDLAKLFRVQYGRKCNHRQACKHLRIKASGSHHRALDDALNVAKLAARLKIGQLLSQ